MDYPNQAELFRVARDEVLLRNTRLRRSVIERQGTDTNALLAGMSAVGDEVVGQLVRVESSLFLDSAKKHYLDRLIFDRYGLPRKSASPAVGSVNFSCPAPAVSAFSIPLGTKLSTTDGKQFVTTAEANFPAGSVGPITVAVRSTKAGPSQQAQKNTITSILGAIPDAAPGLTVTNPLATAGADADELDDTYRERGRNFFTTVRRGTISAVEEAALKVSGVKTAVLFESVDAFGRPAGSAQLIITDAFTEGLVEESSVPPAYQTQSQVLASTVGAALWDVRAAGVFVDVLVAKVVLQGVQLGLSFDGGVNVETVALRARAAVVSLINALPAGSPLLVGDVPGGIVRALRTVPGLVVTGTEVISPPGNVVAAPLEVIRSTLGLVVASSVQPDRALQGSTNPDTVGA